MKLDFVDDSKFMNIWNAVTPFLQLRPRINIPGKCLTCSQIDEKRSNCKDKVVLGACQRIHYLHRRSFIMIERDMYRRNVMYALRNPTRVMSFVSDGMDQTKSDIPHVGNQDKFSSTLSQHIQGFLVHGVGITLYSTLDHVPKGTNVSIYCLLMELLKFRVRNGHFPEEVYCQYDGVVRMQINIF